MTEQMTVVKVGIADMNTVKTPNLIRTSGLGSCVGVVLYDQLRGVAGLAHIMLPDSSLSKTTPVNIAKFADTALVALVKKLERLGAKKNCLKAKIAGGAQMFQFSGTTDIMRIGPRNVEAVKKQLQQLNIPIFAEDVGGNSGRTIEFNPENCQLMIRTVNKGTSVL